MTTVKGEDPAHLLWDRNGEAYTCINAAQEEAGYSIVEETAARSERDGAGSLV
jgi:hypothetical protein